MPDFTARAFGLNRNRSDGPNNAPSSRRLSRILNTDPLAIIVTNRRARLGLTPQAISRHVEQPAKPPAAIQLGRLDRLLERSRRGPRPTK